MRSVIAGRANLSRLSCLPLPLSLLFLSVNIVSTSITHTYIPVANMCNLHPINHGRCPGSRGGGGGGGQVASMYPPPVRGRPSPDIIIA